MSIPFTNPELQPTHRGIIDGSADYDWAIFNQVGNELKVQATGNGLEELEEEFMDGRWDERLSPRSDEIESSMRLRESRTRVYVRTE